jgi:hypothetical protein
MKIYTLLSIAILGFTACQQVKKETNNTSSGISGTWKLNSSMAITKGDTVNTSPEKGIEMIKIFNETHFAFFKHDLNQGKGKDAIYDSGSGTYTLDRENYNEHLEYCSARGWENQNFKFTLKLSQDTLTQRGIEKIDSLKVDREIVEIYTRKGKSL